VLGFRLRDVSWGSRRVLFHAESPNEGIWGTPRVKLAFAGR
jgi:hypothetical protein